MHVSRYVNVNIRAQPLSNAHTVPVVCKVINYFRLPFGLMNGSASFLLRAIGGRTPLPGFGGGWGGGYASQQAVRKSPLDDGVKCTYVF